MTIKTYEQYHLGNISINIAYDIAAGRARLRLHRINHVHHSLEMTSKNDREFLSGNASNTVFEPILTASYASALSALGTQSTLEEFPSGYTKRENRILAYQKNAKLALECLDRASRPEGEVQIRRDRRGTAPRKWASSKSVPPSPLIAFLRWQL